MKFIFFLLFPLLITPSYAEDWKEVRSENGIKVFSRKVPGSKLLAFKAEGTVDMPYAKALALLRDVEAATAWDEALKTKVTVKNISDIEAITYSIVDMPWPLKDRDLVLNNKLEYDKKTMELIVTSHSVTHDDYPSNKKNVRAHIKFANFRFIPVDGKSRLRMEVHVDPRGAIPNWVINMVQKDMPMDFIQRLSKHTRVYPKGPNKGVWDMMQVQAEDLRKVRKKNQPQSQSDNRVN